MLEIRKENDGKQRLFVSGFKVENSTVTNFYEHFDVTTESYETGKLVASRKIVEFSRANIAVVHFKNWCLWTNLQNHIFIGDLEHQLTDYGISFTFSPKLEHWKQSYSFSEYLALLTTTFNGSNSFNGKLSPYDKEETEWFEIEFDIGNGESNLLNEILSREYLLRECHERVIKILAQNQVKNSISESFNFPEKLKVPCEQYLLYFAQFLRDLGIDANSNLKEEAGKVLFSVTPTDDVEALNKIREALALYLSLPSSPIVYDESFKSMRLQQQIENLEHSQKMAVREIQLAEKVITVQSQVIQEKNTIISQKDSTIEQQNKIIEKISSKSIMVDSLENKEELFDGLKIGESEFLAKNFGVHLNPATLVKSTVENLFGKQDERKSILGLDEETDKK